MSRSFGPYNVQAIRQTLVDGWRGSQGLPQFDVYAWSADEALRKVRAIFGEATAERWHTFTIVDVDSNVWDQEGKKL